MSTSADQDKPLDEWDIAEDEMDALDASNVLLNLLGSTPRQRVLRASILSGIIDDDELAAVRDARSEGTSWAEIGRWYGITRQSAHERFADEIADAESPRDWPPHLR